MLQLVEKAFENNYFVLSDTNNDNGYMGIHIYVPSFQCGFYFDDVADCFYNVAEYKKCFSDNEIHTKVVEALQSMKNDGFEEEVEMYIEDIKYRYN